MQKIFGILRPWANSLRSDLCILNCMKTVLIVSKCLRVSKVNKNENCYYFHFKGVYAGEILKSIKLYGQVSWEIHKDEEYLVYAEFLENQNGVLFGKVIKSKRLSDCSDLS